MFKFLLSKLLFIVIIKVCFRGILNKDIFSGELRDLSILGIINKKLIITYKGSNNPIVFYYRNFIFLQRFDDQDDSEKFIKYGFKGSRYHEFEVPNSEEILFVSSNHIYEILKKEKGEFIKIINDYENNNEKSNIIAFKIKNNGSFTSIPLESFSDKINKKLDL